MRVSQRATDSYLVCIQPSRHIEDLHGATGERSAQVVPLGDQMTPERSCSSAALGLAPTICFTGLPSWKRMSVGMDMIW